MLHIQAAEEDIPLKDIVEDNIIKGPIKSSTNYNDYEFRYWLIREVYDNEDYDFNNTKFKGNVKLVPVFKEYPKYYTINLYDDQRNLLVSYD